MKTLFFAFLLGSFLSLQASQYPPPRTILLSWNYDTNENVECFQTHYTMPNQDNWILWHTVYATNITIIDNTNFSTLLDIKPLKK